MEQLEIVRSEGHRAGVTILHIKGPLTLGTLSRFQEATKDPEVRHIVLDLSGVSRIDSAGLGVLLAHWAHTRRHKFAMAIAGMSERVRMIFEITRTDKLLPIFANTEAAEAGLNFPES